MKLCIKTGLSILQSHKQSFIREAFYFRVMAAENDL